MEEGECTTKRTRLANFIRRFFFFCSFFYGPAKRAFFFPFIFFFLFHTRHFFVYIYMNLKCFCLPRKKSV